MPQCPWCCAREFAHVPSEVGLIVVSDHHRQISEIRRPTGAERPHDASESQHVGKDLWRDAEFVCELGDEPGMPCPKCNTQELPRLPSGYQSKVSG